MPAVERSGSDSALPGAPLTGVAVAVSGRLASMTRAELERHVRAASGRIVRAQSGAPTMIVVGEATPVASGLESLPDEIEVVGEAELLVRLGLLGEVGDLGRLFSTAQLAGLLGTHARDVRAQVEQGLLQPVRTVGRLHFFDFAQLARARRLQRLLRAGVRSSKLRHSLARLDRWLPAEAQSSAQLEAGAEGASVLVRLDDGRLVEPDGQLRFDFDGATPRDSVADALPRVSGPTLSRSAEEWFEIGLRAEERGDWPSAEEAYGRALEAGLADAAVSFNLGNVVFAQGRAEGALAHYRRAVAGDPEFAAAWNNLGNALGELGRLEEAMDAYREALARVPTYLDALYNLATTFEQLGRDDLARAAWESYLRLDPSSPTAAEVRARLAR